MYQQDLFDNDKISYLYTEINSIRNSSDRQRKAIFSILTEIQDEILNLKEQMAQKKHEKSMQGLS
jgi:16S rRNA G966 N2-methylase RsmD